MTSYFDQLCASHEQKNVAIFVPNFDFLISILNLWILASSRWLNNTTLETSANKYSITLLFVAHSKLLIKSLLEMLHSYTNYRRFSGDEAFLTDPNAFNDVMNEQSIPGDRKIVERGVHRL